MEAIDMIVIAVIAAIVGCAVAYIVKSKKSGKKCIGCPYGSACGTKGKSCCSASCGGEDKK